MIYVPLSALALASMPARLTAEASGLFSLLRTMGSSAGIAIVTTFYARDAQSAWSALGPAFNPYNPALTDYLARMGRAVMDSQTALQLAAELDRQTRMVAVVDVYWLISFSFLAMLPLLLLLRPRRALRPPAPGEVADAGH